MNRFISIKQELGNFSVKKKRPNIKKASALSNRFSESYGEPVTSINQIKDWLFLINHMVDDSIKKELKKRGLKVQDINNYPNPNVENVNLDFYAVKITKLPKGIATVQPLFDVVRRHLNSLTPKTVEWIPYDNTDKVKWNSNNPKGSVIHLDMVKWVSYLERLVLPYPITLKSLRQATVVCSSYSPNHWIFSTLRDDGKRNANDHPVSGNRYFGFYEDINDKSLVIFTRGADRITWSDYLPVLQAGGKVWEELQSKLVDFINNTGGQAKVHTTEQNTYTWETIRPYTNYSQSKSKTPNFLDISPNKNEFGIAKSGDTASAKLKWEGATADQLQFMRKVYDINEAIYAKRSKYIADVPVGELGHVEGRFKLRKEAATSLRELLKAARAAAKAEHAKVSISITSAYRSASYQFSLWQKYFPDYYKRTIVDRKEMDGGEYGETAAKFLAAYVRKNISSPGHSNHNNGLAVDLRNTQDGTVIRNKTNDGWPGKWRKTWLWSWLEKHAATFHFYQETDINEPWHWVYKKGKRKSVSHGVTKSRVLSMYEQLSTAGKIAVRNALSIATEKDDVKKQILNAIAVYETNRDGTTPIAKESSLDTVAGVKASVKSIGQYIVSRVVSELIKHEHLRKNVSPPLTLTELSNANKRLGNVKILLTKVYANRDKNEDEFIKDNADLIKRTGLKDNDVIVMFKALDLKDTLQKKHNTYIAYKDTFKSTSKGPSLKEKRRSLAQAIPEKDRLGIGLGSLMGYVANIRAWGENRAGWYRKSLASYEVGQRIIKAAEYNDGIPMMFADIQAQLEELQKQHPDYSTEKLVKQIASKHNALAEYPSGVWNTYKRIYGE